MVRMEGTPRSHARGSSTDSDDISCGPGAGYDLGVQALLAAGDLGADGGTVLVGPGRLDRLGAQVEVAGPW
jgi:hypothetical protein